MGRAIGPWPKNWKLWTGGAQENRPRFLCNSEWKRLWAWQSSHHGHFNWLLPKVINNLTVRNKFLKKTLSAKVWQTLKKMGCGKAKGLERRFHKSWYKTFGSSWLNILVFEFVKSITAWPLKISVSAWTKTTWRALNSSRIRLKHAFLSCLQNPEAFCQRFLQMEITCAPLQSSKSSFAIVLPN